MKDKDLEEALPHYSESQLETAEVNGISAEAAKAWCSGGRPRLLLPLEMDEFGEASLAGVTK